MSHVHRVRFLYKTILRLHRGLPAEIQELGNNYVRDEFKRHKSCSPAAAHVFMNEWAVSEYSFYFSSQIAIITSSKCEKFQRDTLHL